MICLEDLADDLLGSWLNDNITMEVNLSLLY